MLEESSDVITIESIQAKDVVDLTKDELHFLLDIRNKKDEEDAMREAFAFTREELDHFQESLSKRYSALLYESIVKLLIKTSRTRTSIATTNAHRVAEYLFGDSEVNRSIVYAIDAGLHQAHGDLSSTSLKKPFKPRTS